MLLVYLKFQLDTFNLIRERMNSDATVITDEERIRPDLSEVNRLFGDNSLMKSLTGWSPKYYGIDGFRKGLEITIDWFLDKENLKHYQSNSYSI